jgi:hypothetical protein
MPTNFITFGAGSKNYIEAGSRLCTQAKNIGLFNKITLFTGEYLQQDIEFWGRHSEFIMKNNKGYGYWLWKPYIIKKTIETLNDGDILLYLDSGCEININKRNEMLNYFNIIKTEHIITAFTYTEKHWNKMDLILYLNANSKEYTDTPQRQAGALLFYVCDKTRRIINEWYDTACNYHLIDDSPSVSKNYDGFKEHRHDQSIFSLLTKKYNIKNTLNIESIIEYIRNRSGYARFK